MTRTLGEGAEGPAALATLQASTAGPTTAAGILEGQQKAATFAADPSAFPRGGVGGSGPDTAAASLRLDDTGRVRGVTATTERIASRIAEIEKELKGKEVGFFEFEQTLTGPERNQRLDELGRLLDEQAALTREYVKNEADQRLKTIDEAAAEAAEGHYNRLGLAAFFAEELAEQTGAPRDVARAHQARATYDAFLHAASADAHLDEADGSLAEADEQDRIAKKTGIGGNAEARRDQALANAESACRAAADDAYNAKQAAKDSGSGAAKRRAEKAERSVRKRWAKMNKLRKKAGKKPLPYPGPPIDPTPPPPEDGVLAPPVGPPVMPDALEATPPTGDGGDSGGGEAPDGGQEEPADESDGGGEPAPDPCEGCKCDPPCPPPSICLCFPKPSPAPPEGEPEGDPGGDPGGGGGGGGDDGPQRGKHGRGGPPQPEIQEDRGSLAQPLSPAGVSLMPGEDEEKPPKGPIQPDGSVPQGPAPAGLESAPGDPTPEGGEVYADAATALEQRIEEFLQKIEVLRAFKRAVEEEIKKISGADKGKFAEQIGHLKERLARIETLLAALEAAVDSVMAPAESTPRQFRLNPAQARQVQRALAVLALLRRDRGLVGSGYTEEQDEHGRPVVTFDRPEDYDEFLRLVASLSEPASDLLPENQSGKRATPRPTVDDNHAAAFARESASASAARSARAAVDEIDRRLAAIDQMLQLALMWVVYIQLGAWDPNNFYVEKFTTANAAEHGREIREALDTLLRHYENGLRFWDPRELELFIKTQLRYYESTVRLIELRAWTLGFAGTVMTVLGVGRLIIGGGRILLGLAAGGAGGGGAALAVTSGGALVAVAAEAGGVAVAVSARTLILDGILALLGANVTMFAASAGGPPGGPPRKPLPGTPGSKSSAPPRPPRDILMPGGKPIGARGTSSSVREMPGGVKEARQMFDELAAEGRDVTRAGHPGKVVELPSGGHVGFRPFSKSGPPTVDVNIPGVPFKEVKFIK